MATPPPPIKSVSQISADKHAKADAEEGQTYLRWWDSYLSPRGFEVTDLYTQIQDGVLPFRLLEALEGLTPAPVQRGKMTIMGKKITAVPKIQQQRGENLNAFLDVVQLDKGIKLVNIHSEHLEQGKVTQVLGLSWELIKFYELGGKSVGPEGGAGAGSDLLDWCKGLTFGYDGIDPSRFDGAGAAVYKKAFKDGKVLCAIIASQQPGGFDYAKTVPWEPEERLRAAFEAGTKMGAPWLLDEAQVAAGAVDYKSLQTYVGALRNAVVATAAAAAERAEQAEKVAKQAKKEADVAAEAAKARAAEEAAAIAEVEAAQEAERKAMEAAAAHSAAVKRAWVSAAAKVTAQARVVKAMAEAEAAAKEKAIADAKAKAEAEAEAAKAKAEEEAAAKAAEEAAAKAAAEAKAAEEAAAAAEAEAKKLATEKAAAEKQAIEASNAQRRKAAAAAAEAKAEAEAEAKAEAEAAKAKAEMARQQSLLMKEEMLKRQQSMEAREAQARADKAAAAEKAAAEKAEMEAAEKEAVAAQARADEEAALAAAAQKAAEEEKKAAEAAAEKATADRAAVERAAAAAAVATAAADAENKAARAVATASEKEYKAAKKVMQAAEVAERVEMEERMYEQAKEEFEEAVHERLASPKKLSPEGRVIGNQRSFVTEAKSDKKSKRSSGPGRQRGKTAAEAEALKTLEAASAAAADARMNLATMRQESADAAAMAEAAVDHACADEQLPPSPGAFGVAQERKAALAQMDFSPTKNGNGPTSTSGGGRGGRWLRALLRLLFTLGMLAALALACMVAYEAYYGPLPFDLPFTLPVIAEAEKFAAKKFAEREAARLARERKRAAAKAMAPLAALLLAGLAAAAFYLFNPFGGEAAADGDNGAADANVTPKKWKRRSTTPRLRRTGTNYPQ